MAEIIPKTHDTSLFRFKLEEEQTLGMTVASAVLVKADLEGKTNIRPYTPTSKVTDIGYFDLVIKRYEQGIISKHIHNLKVGEKLAVKGPIPKIKYTPNMKKEIYLLAGGTGITPHYQVIQEVLSNPDDKTKLTLIYASKTEDDIILKEELDQLASKHDNLKIHHIVSKVNDPSKFADKGIVGHINKQLLTSHLPAPSDDVYVFVCGPPSFMDSISGPKTKDYQQGQVSGYLKELHFNENQVYKF